MLRVQAGDLAGLLAAPGGLDEVAEARVVFVDGHAAGAVPIPSGVPAVFVAIDDGAPADVVVAPEGVERIATAVERNPIAATALAMLLRGAAGRTIEDGLVAESSAYSLLQAGPEHRGWLDARLPETARAEDGPPVRLSRDGDELHITLNRPHVHNAYSAAMRDALVDAFAIAAGDPTIQVRLDGAGPSFCSGGDLSEFGTAPDPATAHLIRLQRSAGRAIAAVADRVTVTVHGACAGAGVELPAFAGRVVAHPDARFWLPEVSMGLVPGAGGTVSLPRRIGCRRVAAFALLGDPIGAQTALEWGLIDAIAPA